MFKSKNRSKIRLHRNGLLATLNSNFQEGQNRNAIVKHKMNVTRSLLDDIKTNNFNDTDMFKELKREDCQKKLRNGVQQEEENEVDLNLSVRKGLGD
jgi:hypothetical protein